MLSRKILLLLTTASMAACVDSRNDRASRELTVKQNIEPAQTSEQQRENETSSQDADLQSKGLELSFALVDAMIELNNSKIVPLKVPDPDTEIACPNGGSFTYFASQRDAYRKEFFSFKECKVVKEDPANGFEILLNGPAYIAKQANSDRAIFSDKLVIAGKSNKETFSRQECIVNFIVPQYAGSICGHTIKLYKSSDDYPNDKSNFLKSLPEYLEELSPKHELLPRILGQWTSSGCELDPLSGSYKSKISFKALTVTFERTYFSDTACKTLVSEYEFKYVYWLLGTNEKETSRFDMDGYLLAHKVKFVNQELLNRFKNQNCPAISGVTNTWQDLIELGCLSGAKKGTATFSTLKLADNQLITTGLTVYKSYRLSFEDSHTKN